jgi:hypothetical protein
MRNGKTGQDGSVEMGRRDAVRQRDVEDTETTDAEATRQGRRGEREAAGPEGSGTKRLWDREIVGQVGIGTERQWNRETIAEKNERRATGTQLDRESVGHGSNGIQYGT